MTKKKVDASKKDQKTISDNGHVNAQKNETVEKEKSQSKEEKKENVDNEVIEEKEETTEEKLKEFQDKYLRLSAEFDNYRKRTLKEKIELTKTAGEDILMKLLPVKDDFERALQSIEEAKDIEGVKEGIHLIYNKFSEFFKQQGIKEIEALNKEFDTDLHEAVTKIPTSDKDLKGKIVDVIEKGYFLNEKILRYPKVVVGE